MKKKFYFISYFLVILIIYISFGIFGIFEINNYKELLFKNRTDLEFHKNYSDKIHHLRDVNKLNSDNNNYLFSEIIFNDNFKKTILLQGDSWIEDISNIKNSELFVKNFGKNNKINIYNAGITSFAPSVMHAQFKILKKDFNIFPQILIIHLDQTDIGDESCRYKHNKIYSSNGDLIRVQREKFTRATYDYSKIYLYSELYLSNNLLKILKFPYLKTQYFIKRNFNLVNQIQQKGLKLRNDSKCGFYQIQKELMNYDYSSKVNFQKSLKEYLEFLSYEKNLEKIYLTSFPHLNNLKNIYEVNISEYIDEVLVPFDNKRFKHINMSKMDFSSVKIESIYRENDVASHLNDYYHKDLFLKEILSKINK